jgi:UDP-N-acetylmuramoylalanine--D-glutamate ligase
MYKKIINELANKNIAILGFGKEGESTYNFIRKYLDIELTIIDKVDVRNKINDDKVKVIYGENYLDNLDKYDLVIKSPGISLIDIDTTNINITSGLELVLKYFKGLSIGITGTKGKSTTTTLIYDIIKNQDDNTYLVGNIGIPILDEVEKYNDKTNLIIEMSSHMLEYMKTSPRIGLILNLYQDHLDHDKTVEHYHHNKLNIFKYQTSSDIAIYNLDNNYLKEYMANNKYLAKTYSISTTTNSSIYYKDNKYYYKDTLIYDTTDFRHLIGNYNISNIVFALTAIYLGGYDLDKAREVVRNFKPVDYRMMKIDTIDNVTYYSDTLSTIPMGTISGIEALDNVSTLIFGGMDRGIDYEEFIDYLNKSKIKHFICMPTTGYKIGKMLQDKDVYYSETLEEAVKTAIKVTDKNSICLLSPAASSYEYFKNYKEKADKYREYIYKYTEK